MLEIAVAVFSFGVATAISLSVNRILGGWRIGSIDNLPAEATTRDFIGFAKELDQLASFTEQKNPETLIGITGISGAGKTTLALRFARLAKKEARFSTIYYFPFSSSARNPVLQVATGFTNLVSRDFINLEDESKRDSKEVFRALLAKQRSLLILDNLERLKKIQQEQLIKYFSLLPSTTKTILISRTRLETDNTIHLSGLNFSNFAKLVSLFALRHKEKKQLSNNELRAFFEISGGLPQIANLIGELSKDFSAHSLLSIAPVKINSFIGESLENLERKEEVDWKILNFLSTRVDGLTLSEIKREAGVESSLAVESKLMALRKLNLISEGDGRFTLHPSIRSYVSSLPHSQQAKSSRNFTEAQTRRNYVTVEAPRSEESYVVRTKLSGTRKQAILAEYETWLSKSEAVFVTEYSGLTMPDFDELRKRIREAGGEFHIVKNTLGKRAFESAGIDVPDSFLVGSTAVGLAFSDAPSVAKAISDFAKDKEAVKIKGGFLGKQVINEGDISQLATLGSINNVRTKLLTLIGARYGLEES